MKNNYSILVTGCGGDIGQSIGKILHKHKLVKSLYGIDISDKNPSKFIFQFFSLGLPCDNKNYISSLESFVKKNNIDIIIPASESEIRFLTKNKIKDKIGTAILITASYEAELIGFDKLKTAFFLKEKKLTYPQTCLISKINSIKQTPVICKSRQGSGSSNVHLIEDQESFDLIKKKNPDFILQEYIEDDLGEFTCGVYQSSNKELRTIIFKRELTAGYSSYGKVVENKEISALLREIASGLDLKGSINVQLRLTNKGPVVFEINPRFSSTVLFRHMFGFKDLIWSIKDALGLKISPYKSNMVGREFYKGFSEYIL